jgi:hypothetical protein
LQTTIALTETDALLAQQQQLNLELEKKLEEYKK